MGRSFGFIALIIVVAIGGYIYTRQAQSVSAVGGTPETALDVISVRNDLFAMANAEKRYYAINAKYASIGELRSNGDINIPTREHYSYSIQTSDSGFKIVAAYNGSDAKAPKRIAIDDTMALTTK